MEHNKTVAFVRACVDPARTSASQHTINGGCEETFHMSSVELPNLYTISHNHPQDQVWRCWIYCRATLAMWKSDQNAVATQKVAWQVVKSGGLLPQEVIGHPSMHPCMNTDRHTQTCTRTKKHIYMIILIWVLRFCMYVYIYMSHGHDFTIALNRIKLHNGALYYDK